MTISAMLRFLSLLMFRNVSDNTAITAKIIYRDERGVVLIEYADICKSPSDKPELCIDGNSRRSKP